ncbi:MAG TPA: cyanophycin synthetase [Rubricoccaceae bacterium]|nr:cyanophycin synthetase [Rubricoccaceae bacterium]
MKIRSTNVYIGPNLYAHFPVIRHVIDLGPLEAWPTGRLGEGFVNGLLGALPGLEEHGCSYREPGGFVRRMTEDRGTWLGHVWEHAAIELQGVAGTDVTFGKTRSTGRAPGEYDMIYQYRQREVGLEAGELARRLLLWLLPEEAKAEVREALGLEIPEAFDWPEERDAFIRSAQRRAFGPSTQSLLDAADRRDIPWLRLNEYSLVQFGHGKYQKRIQATITSETRHIAVSLASDKEETRNLLADLGLPVPAQQLVYSEEGAVEAAERIGYPVVVKPLNANHGRGISINLATPEQVRAAVAVAREHGTGRGVLVEQFVQGFDHRMLVINGALVAVAKRVPGHVVGDGRHTIEQLVEIINADPRRGVGHEKVLTKLAFDAQAGRLMEQAGYTRETVLPEGEVFYLRSTANLSTGGTSVDLTDVVHPDNRDMAIRAVEAIGLDVGGVDFLTTDITRSYHDVGGAIVEVNAAPGFRMHVAPSEGTPRDVAGPVMDMLFPRGTPSRIPIAAITGTNGKTTVTRMVAHIVKSAGYTPGMTSTDGVLIAGRLTVKGDMTGPVASRMVLRDPRVDAAVLEVARGGLVRSGLGFSKCDVGAVLNIQGDHLGLGGVNTLEELAAVKQIVVEVAENTAVLNADDERCLAMVRHTDAEHLCYVTMNAENDLVREHIRADGRAVVLEKGINGEMITIYDRHRHIPLLWTHLIPSTLDGKATHNVQNALFATAIAYALGEGPMRLTLDDIRHGLRTFTTSFYEAPGRLNVYDGHPFRVILDYAHNPAAVGSMVELADRLDVDGRRLLVLSAPGDRRDEDYHEIARHAAGHFDRYICKRDDNARGRGPDEVPRLLRQFLLEEGVSEDAIEVVVDEQDAVAHALRTARHGDLVLIFGDKIARCWEQIVRFDPATGEFRAEEHIPGDGLAEPSGVGAILAEAPPPSPLGGDGASRRLKRGRRAQPLRVSHDEDAD